MKQILNSKEMKQIDSYTIDEFCVPSMVLMERAALAVVDFLEEKALLDQEIGILCGMGNNGGDGLAIARILFLRSCKVKILLIGNHDKMSVDCKKQFSICQKYHVPVVETLDEFSSSTVLIDSLFGIGLQRTIEGEYKNTIQYANEMEAVKIAVDIPSGVSGDNGNILGCGLKCDYTITFAHPKVGHCLFPGKSFCGHVICKDIGIYDSNHILEGMKRYAVEDIDLNILPKAAQDANKGTLGKILLIAGSEEMAGAAYLSAYAALTTGSGLVKVYTTSNNRDIILSKLPEALVICYDKFNENQLLELLQWANVVAIGPGLGKSKTAVSLVKSTLKNASVPLVMDADALNIISEDLSLLKNPHTEIVLTPHIGEMSRLTGNPKLYIQDNKLEVCEAFARDYQVICVLKDAATITAVPYEASYINTSGSPALATAGSGDVLTGVIASLIGQGLRPNLAAPIGVYLHGKAGEISGNKYSIHGSLASHIIEGIRLIYKERGL